MNYEITNAHISTIRPGDTIEHGGQLKTVCRSDIKQGFMGKTLFGDAYRLGSVPVKKAVIQQASRWTGASHEA